MKPEPNHGYTHVKHLSLVDEHCAHLLTLTLLQDMCRPGSRR